MIFQVCNSDIWCPGVTGRVACKQMMPKDERRSIKGGKEREGKNLAKVDRYLHGKRGGVNSG